MIRLATKGEMSGNTIMLHGQNPEDLPSTRELHNRLMEARCRLIAVDEWYGIMASKMVWRRADEVNTMGVRMLSNGNILCRWSGPFVNSLKTDHLIAVIKHEIEHIVRVHVVRWYGRDATLWNYAADMLVNGTSDHPNIDDLPYSPVFYCHPEHDKTTEEVYDWLDKHSIKLPVDRDFLDNHDEWKESTAGEDQARQMAKEWTEEATRRAGAAPGHLTQAIQALQNELKQYVGKQVGIRRKTWSRRSRREDRFGVKGVSSHGSTKLVVLCDTSGSISERMLRQFFSELELMSTKFKITLVQFDHVVQSVEKYRRGDWKKIEVHGRGGTSFVNAINTLKELKIVGRVNIILTDGYAGWPEPEDFEVLWAIIGGKDHPVPPWGRVLHIED